MRKYIIFLMILMSNVIAQADEKLHIRGEFIVESEQLTKDNCQTIPYNETAWAGYIWDDEKNSCYMEVSSPSGEYVRVYLDENFEFTEVVRSKRESK